MKNGIDSSGKWRFWPVMVIAFIYPINNSLIGLAIPLYYFQQRVDIFTIGFLAAGTTITYCFSPILLNNLGDKLGRKPCIIIALSGTFIAQTIFYITLDPLIFLLSRITEGFTMGLFWPNLQSSISDKSFFNNDRYISRYNFSWNFGILIGFSTGAIILFYIQDVKIIFYIGPILIFISLVLTILFFQESKNNKMKSPNLEKLNIRSDLNSKHWYIPIFLPFILVIAFSMAKSSVNLLYPIKSEIIGFEPYTVYLLAFCGIITQLLGTTIASYLKTSSIRKISIISMIFLIVVSVLYGINYNFIIFILLYFMLGFFSGLLYSFGLKMILLLNVEKNTSRFSSIYESTIGLTFLIIPITSGYIAVSNLDLAFYIISIEIFLTLLVSLIYFKKFQM